MNRHEHSARGRHLVWVYTQALSEQLDAATWLETTRHLRAMGWRVTLITADPQSVRSCSGVPVLPMKKPDTYFVGQAAFHARVVHWILRNWRQIDVVLFHQMSAPWLLPLRTLKSLRRGKGPKLVMDTRTLPMVPRDNATWRDRLRHRFYTLMGRVANRFADGRTAITQRMADAEGIPAGRLLGTWPSAVDVDLFAPAQETRTWPGSEDAVGLVYVGALHHERMLLNLCRAVERANHAGMRYTLTLVGQGSQRAELAAFASQTEDRIRVQAPVPHAEVPPILAQNHLGVLPFPDQQKFRVSSPIKLYEYLAAGLAVLATRIVCHTDVMDNADYSIWSESASEEALFSALEGLWPQRTALAKMGQQAAADARGHTWHDSAAALSTGLERILPHTTAQTAATSPADIDPKTLRVAYLLHRFPALRETYVVREMYWLRQMGVDVRIYSLLSPRPTPVHEQAESLMPYVRYSKFVSLEILKAHLHFLLRSPGRYLVSLGHLIWQTLLEPGVLLRALAVFPETVLYAQHMQSQGIDHIHAHFVWLAGISAGVISDLTGIPFSTCPHAFGLFGRNRRDIRIQLENADAIVTISDYNRRTIAGLSPTLASRDIAVVHCGVEVDRYTPTDRSGRTERPGILSVGGLVEKKGHAHLIEAVAILASRGIDFCCEIVGAGPLHGELQRLLETRDLRDRLWLLGALNHDDVTKLYARADIFALACVVAADGDRDGIPVSIMEAMACGLPVVSTAVSGIPELVRDGETGLCVPPGDPQAFADALQRLIEDAPLRRQLGAGARQIILEQFQARETAATMARVFAQTVAASRAQRALETPRQGRKESLPPTQANPARGTIRHESQGD